MIPAHNHHLVLPPFVGNDPTELQGRSPYDATMCELVDRFGTNPERIKILSGLIQYRCALAKIGVLHGHQWLSGSFTENVEVIRGRPPNDIDIVTIAFRPIGSEDDVTWYNLLNENLHLFDPNLTKKEYSCDAYFIDLNIDPVFIAENVSYWYGLFSHQRDGGLWKGMLRVSLQADDGAASAKLAGSA